MPFPESKIESYHRLVAEGRWNSASRFRDEQRTRLRAEGMRRAEAREVAWKLMRKRFGPPDYVGLELALSMQMCPPRIPDAADQWKFTSAWQALWILASRLTPYDEELRCSLNIEGLLPEYLWELHSMLAAEEQNAIRSCLELESNPIADRLTRPQPTRLIAWARPLIEAGTDSIDRKLLHCPYDRICFGFLSALQGAWDTLEESLQLFWEEQSVREGLRAR